MRFNFGKRSQPVNARDLHLLEVGQPHPVLTPPPHGGQAIGLETGCVGVDMFYAPPIDWEVAALAGTCVAYGMHLTQDILVPIFVFQGAGSQWAIHAPVQASNQAVDEWIRDGTNRVNFCLMEAGTGIVRQLRHIGLEADFTLLMKTALAHVPHPANLAAYASLLDEIGPEGLWQGAKQWVWDRQAGEFRQV